MSSFSYFVNINIYFILYNRENTIFRYIINLMWNLAERQFVMQ